MINNFLVLLFIPLLLTGCSSTPDPDEEQQQVYSDETNRAFELIERGYNAPPLRKAPPVNPAPQVEIRPQPAQKNDIVQNIPEAKKTKRAAPAIRAKKNSEKLIELNQNLAFYCMKHRKNPTFKNDEKKCMDHVTRVLNDCQNRSGDIHTKLLSCVKKRLGKF